MSDFVVRFPVHPGREAQLFGDYLSAFLARLAQEAELWAAEADAPWLMMHSDLMQDVEVKVLTFQQASAAHDFTSGWDLARQGLPAG